ncbi:MAG TPA: 1-(5-phosphoribosyl)-5-[(5-phosphoribosylamino)methylideneamino]imidazole-4-carboxamide isomerase [Anaerolineae bacterium]
MIVYPAIDLRGGQVVRLRQGDPQAQTVYGSDPAGVARRWADQGAQWLHVVNLDGAFGEADREPVNLRRLAEIRAAVDLPIQFGGGVRSLDDIARALALGATRVVLGTAAVRDPQMVAEAVTRFGGECIVAGIDARGGLVAIAGWQETAAVTAADLARQMADLGVPRAVYTDISRDGTLAGANVETTAALAQASGLRLIASGGVAGLPDIVALAARASAGIEGVIVGQALYTGAIDLREAIAAAGGV